VKRIANAYIRFCQIAALSSELKVANLTNNVAKKTWFQILKQVQDDEPRFCPIDFV